MINNTINKKIFFLFQIIFLFFILFTKSHSNAIDENGAFVTYGKDTAPIKIKVFSSLTCPHCANFHTNVITKINEKYIKKGKVQLMHYDFPLDQSAFNASKILHCLDKKNQQEFLDTVYKEQNNWTIGSNINDINKNLKKIVRKLGIKLLKFDECLINENISDRILHNRIDATKRYLIESTPTIIINEKKFEDSVNFQNIDKKIEKILKDEI